MAVVTVKSAAITNRDSVPKVLNNARVTGSFDKHAFGVCTVTNTDSVGSKFIYFSVPSNAVMLSVKATAPDIGTTTAGDIGLYRTTADGGAVVDADFFASALVLNAGAITKSEVLLESGVITIANLEKPVWELLGLTSDPQVQYDVVLTLTGAADATGAVMIEADYTQ